MSWHTKYNARININGSNDRERIINSTKTLVSNTFIYSPSYQQVYINDSNNLTDVWIVDDSKTKELKKLIMLPDESLSTGDLITWNSDRWLTLIVDNGEIQDSGSIQKCISQLKWIDSQGIQRETWFTTKSDTLSNYGVDEGRIIDLGNERRHILIPNNEHTVNIKKDKRFIFDDRAWRVTSYDRIGMNRIIYLVLQEDEINPATDRVDLGIADYQAVTYSLNIKGGDSISVTSGEAIQLDTEILKDSQLVSDMDVVWESSDTNIVTVDESGILTAHIDGSVTVTAVLDIDDSVSDTIDVNVESVIVDAYTMQITSTSITPNEIRKSQTKDYQIKVYNNGVLISEDVTWELYDDDQTNVTTLATITSQSGTECSVKNNGYASGSVQLKAILQSDNSVVAWLRIQMKSIFG